MPYQRTPRYQGLIGAYLAQPGERKLKDYWAMRQARSIKTLAEVKDILWDSPTIHDHFINEQAFDTGKYTAIGVAPNFPNIRNGVMTCETNIATDPTSGADQNGRIIIRRSQGIKYLARVRLNQTVQHTVEMGLKATTTGGVAATHFIVFRNTPGASAANWFGRTNDGTTSSAVDLGVLGISTAYVELMFIVAPSGGTVSFLIDGVLRNTQTSNLPGDTTDMQLHIYLNRSNTDDHSMDVDRVTIWPALL